MERKFVTDPETGNQVEVINKVITEDFTYFTSLQDFLVWLSNQRCDVAFNLKVPFNDFRYKAVYIGSHPIPALDDFIAGCGLAQHEFVAEPANLSQFIFDPFAQQSMNLVLLNPSAIRISVILTDIQKL